MKHAITIFLISCLTMPFLAFSQDTNEANEPTIDGPGVIGLLEGGTLDAWKVPSAHWYLDEEIIVGHTEGQLIETPEWLYTKQGFSDFAFTCEMKLSGDNHRNTGIYYRVKIILFQGHQDNTDNENDKMKPFEAPSGYEFDAAFYKPTMTNFRGSLGDWYARPSLRIFPDPAVIDQAYQPEKWNRMTIRARGNRLEYWMNGIKVMDYLDHDPEGSREGIIGFQIHDGSVMKVEYRNIRVLPLEP